MVNKIDKTEFRFIDVAFIQKTNLRQKLTVDVNGKDSLAHLQNIIESDKPMIKTLYLEHDAVKRTYKGATGVISNSKNILEYHFVWARIILEFYYFYHDTKDDAQKIIDKMISFEDFVYINEAVQKGLKLIDDYYINEQNETKADTSEINIHDCLLINEKVPQQSEKVQSPDILQLMQDINSGKIHHLDVNWEEQLQYILKLCNQMTIKIPYVIWLWGVLSIVEDPIKRIDILGKLQDVAPECFDSASEEILFQKDCGCIVNICTKVRGDKIRGAKVVHEWTDERKSLNDLVYILCDEMIDPLWMVTLADNIYCRVQNKEREDLLTCVLRAFHPVERLSISNIVDFAKNLYIAEGFRQFILSGKVDYMDIPVLEDIDPLLLKGCFEVYIKLRCVDIKKFIDRDLTHVGSAEKQECWEKLLEEENQHINRENSIEEFYGSAAYRALWYPGKEQVENMINAFSIYLQNKIIRESVKPAVPQIKAKNVNILNNHGPITNYE